MSFLPRQFLLAAFSQSLLKIQCAEDSLLSSLMSSLHRVDGPPLSPSPALERLAFLQSSTGFSSNICQLGNEHTPRKLGTFKDHLNNVGNVFSPSSPLLLPLLLSPMQSQKAVPRLCVCIGHHSPAPCSIIDKPTCLWFDFLTQLQQIMKLQSNNYPRK